MPKKPHRLHMAIGPTETLCGRSIVRTTGWKDRPAFGWNPLPPEQVVTDLSAVTCKVCLEAAHVAG